VVDIKQDQESEGFTYVITPQVIPGDSGFGSQWHLVNTSYPGVDVNVTTVWDDYQGNGVVVGVVDTGIDYNHPDLNANYRFDLDYDARSGDSDSYASASDDNHGTTVAGVIGAAIGGGSTVGIAPGADITGFRIGFGTGGSGQTDTQMQNMATVDVANNSWGYNGFFTDNFLYSSFAASANAIENAVATGRSGLGTIITFSSGNSRQEGDNVNYHSFGNSQHTIAVGAIGITGSIASFSTPGAAVLVSAPGVNIYTTDRLGSAGYSGGDYTSISGTSFSSPAVAAVTALILEANPDLGYRDVQEILAYSSRNPTASNSGWQTNGANNWNGGGLLVSDDYGFGLVDAYAAVRLAETWTEQSTFANLISTSTSTSPNFAINDLSTTSSSVSISNSNGLEIDHVEVELHLDHTYIGDLSVRLTSPDGTTSLLVNRPGVSGSSTWGTSQNDIDAILTSVQHWGETGEGTWTLAVTDSANNDQGILRNWSLSLFGDALNANDTYIYTDEWARHGGEAGRSLITDSGGIDTLNFAAIDTNLTFDLTSGTSNTLFGHSINIASSSLIENLYAGDGADIITGNAADNTLMGGRGDDTLAGGAGVDTALFDGDFADFNIGLAQSVYTVTDLAGSQGTDIISGFEFFQFEDQTIAVDNGSGPIVGTSGNDTLTGRIGADTIDGLAGDDLFIASSGNDSLIGGAGNDTVVYGEDGTNYDVQFDSTDGTWLVNDLDSSAINYGSNVLDGIERIQFADRDIALASNGTSLSAINSSIQTSIDTSTSWSLTGSGGDGGLTYSLETGPANGTVTVTADGTYDYTPSLGYQGSDTFSFRVTDGRGLSSVATVSIGVGPGETETRSSAAAWEGNAAFAFAGDDMFTTARNDMAVRTVDTLSGDFRYELTVDSTMTQAINFRAGFYDVAEDGQFVATGSLGSGGMTRMSTSFHLFSSGSSMRVHYGGGEVANLGVWSDNTQFRLERVGGVVSIYQNDALAHTFTQEFADDVRLVRGSGGYAPELVRDISWTDVASEGVLATAGNDAFVGTDGDDVFDGLAGNDRLTGGKGNDTLSGGAGDDHLSGGTGDDVYGFGRSDGQDSIDNIGEGTSNDKIVFGTGVNTDQLWFSQSGNDLLVSIIGSEDHVNIDDWYLDAGANQVAEFKTSSGSGLIAANVENLVSAMAAFSPPAFGETELSQTLHDNLDSVIAANWQ
jgi:subtilisin-like proprotein convertase family protein/Ca2+-binding RTX toxin-like protein